MAVVKAGRWAAGLAIAPLLVLAAACGEENGPAPPSPASQGGSTGGPATVEEQLLASMPPTAEEVGRAFPDRTWTASSFGRTAGPQGVGPVGSWGAAYGTTEGEEITLTLDLYESATDAGSALQGIVDQPDPEGVEVERFEAPGVGDEAEGQVNRPPEGLYTIMFLRVDRVVAGLFVPRGDAFGERRDEVLALARTLAARIEAALAANE